MPRELGERLVVGKQQLRTIRHRLVPMRPRTDGLEHALPDFAPQAVGDVDRGSVTEAFDVFVPRLTESPQVDDRGAWTQVILQVDSEDVPIEFRSALAATSASGVAHSFQSNKQIAAVPVPTRFRSKRYGMQIPGSGDGCSPSQALPATATEVTVVRRVVQLEQHLPQTVGRTHEIPIAVVD